MQRKFNAKKRKEMEYYDDEIDLFDLFQKIWKWKWLIVVIVAFSTIVTFLVTNNKPKPATYTSEAIIKVGRIANSEIDVLNYNSPTVYYILKQIEKKCAVSFTVPKGSVKTQINFAANKEGNNVIKKDFSLLIEPANNLYSISITSVEPKLTSELVNFVIKSIINEHKKLYINGINKLKENIAYFKEKKAAENSIYFSVSYLLDSFNYESEIITNPVLVKNPYSKKLTVKLAVAFMASLFIGIFLSLFIEFILSHKREKTRV